MALRLPWPAPISYKCGRSTLKTTLVMPEAVDIDERNLAHLLDALRVLPAFQTLKLADLEPTGFTGMAHDHVRLKSRDMVARIPRVSQWGLAATINLAYQTACFRRAYPSGHTPKLHAVLPPSDSLPMGALVVEEIPGRKVRLPDDLDAIATALRAVHELPLPILPERRPLLSPERSLAHMLKTIEFQADFIERAKLPAKAEAQLREELAWARHYVTEHRHPEEPRTLIFTDSHPGNFVIHPSGKAYFVDLEKAMYAIPAIDLAHATLYTSTRFDADIDAVLTPEETTYFYREYLRAMNPRIASALRPWLAPVRRLVWLRTMTWCIKWTVESQGSDGWSRYRLEPRTRRHAEACLKDFFDPQTIARIRAEWLQDEQPSV